MQTIDFHLLGGEWAKHMQVGFGTTSPQKVASSKATVGGRGKATFHQRDTGEFISMSQLQVEKKPVFFENLRPPTCCCASLGFILTMVSGVCTQSTLQSKYKSSLEILEVASSPLVPNTPRDEDQSNVSSQSMLPNTKGAMHHQQEPRGKEGREKKIRMRSSWTSDTGIGYKMSMLKMFTEISRNGK